MWFNKMPQFKVDRKQRERETGRSQRHPAKIHPQFMTYYCNKTLPANSPFNSELINGFIHF
jgi:hypothetical protein